MRRWAVGLLALAATLGAIGCEGQSDLAAEADEICSEFEERFAASGNRGMTNPQIVDEVTFTNRLVRERQERLRELEPSEEERERWRRFLDAGERFIEVNRQVIEAAERGDAGGVRAAFGRLAAPAVEREELAGELGMEVCGLPPDPEVEETGTGPPEGLEHPEPVNSPAEATEAVIAAVADEDCGALRELAHSHLGFLGKSACDDLFSTLEGAEPLGSERYGPAGVGEVETVNAEYITVYFVLGDGDELRFAGYVINDGRGLRPANEDADAEETVAALLEAVSEGDGQALAEQIADPLDDPVPEELRAALEGGEEPSAAPLGINQALSFHLVTAGADRFVLVLAHMPGGRSEYRLTDVLPLPPAEGDDAARET